MGKYILIVEDQLNITSLLQTAFKERGVNVHVAKDGQEAIDAIDKDLPQLMLLDLLLPGVDGFGVLEHIKACPFHGQRQREQVLELIRFELVIDRLVQCGFELLDIRHSSSPN